MGVVSGSVCHLTEICNEELLMNFVTLEWFCVEFGFG